MIRIAVPAVFLLAQAGAQLRKAADRVQALEDLRPPCAAYREWAERAADLAEGMERLCAEVAAFSQGQTPN